MFTTEIIIYYHNVLQFDPSTTTRRWLFKEADQLFFPVMDDAILWELGEIRLPQLLREDSICTLLK